MKGMIVRVAGLVLIASQLSSCAWLAAWRSRSESVLPEPEPPKPAPKPPKPKPPGPDKPPEPQTQPDPEPTPGPEPEPQPQPPAPAPAPLPKQNAPIARAVPGKPGFVFSPFNNKLIDVQGIARGRLVADPHYPAGEKKYFRVP